MVIPAHRGAAFLAASEGLGDALGFVTTNPHTLQCSGAPNIFALGDAANVPIGKAGMVTLFEGETLVKNVVHYLRDEPLEPSYDGHSSGFVETGFSKAMLIDFNYDVGSDTEEHPGPFGLPLLKETHLNHLGKMMFQWLYWHNLLAGRNIPGLHSAMSPPVTTPRVDVAEHQ